MTESSVASGSIDSSAEFWRDRIAAAQQGDRDALGAIFQRLGKYLRARAEEGLDGQLKVKVSPSDIVQETLLEAYRGFAKFTGQNRTELLVWLQGILNHRVKTAYRMYRGTSKRNLAREVPLGAADDSDQEIQLMLDSQSTPSGNAIAAEELARLEEAVRKLPPRYEQVIRLRNELKLSFIEIGIALSCSDDAAQKLWTRAIDALTEMLGTPEAE